MKHVYQWIKVSAEDISKGQFLIKNKYQFIDLKDLPVSGHYLKMALKSHVAI